MFEVAHSAACLQRGNFLWNRLPFSAHTQRGGGGGEGGIASSGYSCVKSCNMTFLDKSNTSLTSSALTNIAWSNLFAFSLSLYCFEGDLPRRNKITIASIPFVQHQRFSTLKCVATKLILCTRTNKQREFGCRYSSVDLYALTILLPRVWVPSAQSML